MERPVRDSLCVYMHIQIELREQSSFTLTTMKPLSEFTPKKANQII